MQVQLRLGVRRGLALLAALAAALLVGPVGLVDAAHGLEQVACDPALDCECPEEGQTPEGSEEAVIDLPELAEECASSGEELAPEPEPEPQPQPTEEPAPTPEPSEEPPAPPQPAPPPEPSEQAPPPPPAPTAEPVEPPPPPPAEPAPAPPSLPAPPAPQPAPQVPTTPPPAPEPAPQAVPTLPEGAPVESAAPPVEEVAAAPSDGAETARSLRTAGTSATPMLTTTTIADRVLPDRAEVALAPLVADAAPAAGATGTSSLGGVASDGVAFDAPETPLVADADDATMLAMADLPASREDGEDRAAAPVEQGDVVLASAAPAGPASGEGLPRTPAATMASLGALALFLALKARSEALGATARLAPSAKGGPET